jgi:ATP-dependent Lon protease
MKITLAQINFIVGDIEGNKEKIIAAKRNKIDKIFLSRDNKRDVEWLDKELIEGIEFVFVDNYLEIFKEIFK